MSMMQAATAPVPEATLNPEQSAVAALMSLNTNAQSRYLATMQGPNDGDAGATGGSQFAAVYDSSIYYSNYSTGMVSASASAAPTVPAHVSTATAVQDLTIQAGTGVNNSNPPNQENATVADNKNGGNRGQKPKPRRITKDPQMHRLSEKRRRERINSLLAELCQLMPNEFVKKNTRAEKAEIINGAVRYLKHLKESVERADAANAALAHRAKYMEACYRHTEATRSWTFLPSDDEGLKVLERPDSRASTSSTVSSEVTSSSDSSNDSAALKPRYGAFNLLTPPPPLQAYAFDPITHNFVPFRIEADIIKAANLLKNKPKVPATATATIPPNAANVVVKSEPPMSHSMQP